MTSHPRVFVAGIGGFARVHHEALWQLEREGLLTVYAACDPAVKRLDGVIHQFAFHERGVQAFSEFNAMLASFPHAEAMPAWASIAAPIPFHAAMHRKCVESGIACYLEKPPTLDPRELGQMINLESEACLPTQVGFNHIGQEARLELKRRIVSGEFGRLREVRFIGAWKRPTSYFARSPWAGRLALNGRLLLDSCLGNGMSHHVHNLLFFSGRRNIYSWAACESMEAELYRVNDIEGPDTLFLRGEIEGGVRFRLGLTNSCDDPDLSLEELDFDKASVIIHPHDEIVIRHSSGAVESLALPNDFPLSANFRRYLAYFHGDIDRPTTRLEDCRPLVDLNAMAFLACEKIHRVPDEFIEKLPVDSPLDTVRYMPGVVTCLRAFLDDGRFPSEKDCPWGRPGGSAVAGDLAELPVRINRLIKDADPECAGIVSLQLFER